MTYNARPVADDHKGLGSAFIVVQPYFRSALHSHDAAGPARRYHRHENSLGLGFQKQGQLGFPKPLCGHLQALMYRVAFQTARRRPGVDFRKPRLG